ncbi:MAG: NADH-quinone oxidoreductase subunit M [Candidatus Lambdaproteobacteria bacterium]|nr:NADH-quinone oxidoreductase subunit M [Candidatus Lambdaproteobacteria bacterium]
MTILGLPILSFVIFFPMAGVLLLLFVDRERAELAKWVALVASGITFLISLPLFYGFDEAATGFQFVERAAWIPAWGAEYQLGLDGISLFLVLLTTLLTFLSILGSWTSVQEHVREFLICLLLLEVGMTGVFVALDMFLFFVFWEVMLFPMYFLIGVWGSDRRLYAAIKFVVYTMSASALMLVAILVTYYLHYRASGRLSFSLLDWYTLQVGLPAQYWLFAAFALAFAVKVPMWPFHTWLPDAHVEAPTAGSVILAGVLLKMGTYGFLRFAMPLFPQATEAAIPFLIGLSVIGILYGALVCMVQPDMKKLVAYSSVSHLGFVMLGLFALNLQGVQGSVLQMLNHGVSTGGLFFLVGMIYERRHTKAIAEFGGLIRVMPIYAAFMLIFVLSSIGLPSLNGFVGEYLILLGAYQVSPIAAILSASAVIVAAVYLLWMYQRVFFGVISNAKNLTLRDLPLREVAVLVPLVVLILWGGIYPKTFLGKTEASVAGFLKRVRIERQTAQAAQPAPEAALARATESPASPSVESR